MRFIGRRKIGVDRTHFKAIFSQMVGSLYKYERIVTTTAKAKECRFFAERVITWAKKDTEKTSTKAKRFLQDYSVVPKLFGELKERYAQRTGGYTRVLKLGQRKGDGAHMSVIELVDNPLPPIDMWTQKSRLARNKAEEEPKKAEGAETEAPVAN